MRTTFTDQLIQKFHDFKIIKRKGPEYPKGFTLKSGAKSDIYIDIRDLIKHPSLFNFTMFSMHQMLCTEYDGPDPTIIGIPTMGAVIAPIMAYKRGWHLAVIRQHKKTHGIGHDIEGVMNNQLVVVDDVITSGTSLREMCDTHFVSRWGNDYQVEMFVIVDRQNHSIPNVHSLMTLEEIKKWK
jgi:orotate phosphoribosyltransferase